MNMNKYVEKLIEKAIDYGTNIFDALLVIIIGYIIMKVVSKIIMKFIEKTNRDEIILNFIHTCIKVLIGIIIAITALAQLGVNTASIVAVFTTATAAIALAFKDTLTEVVDGMKIMVSRPFIKGDLIEVEDTTGRIQEISLFYTFLLTTDNKRVIIPNSKMAASKLINYSSEEKRRVDLTFDVGYESDIEFVKQVIYDVAISSPLCVKDIEPFVRLTEYKDSSITFTLRVWTTTEHFEQFKFNIVEDIKKRFDKEGINIPYPQMDIHMKDVN